MPHVLGCAPEITFAGIYRDPRDVVVATGVTRELDSVTAPGDYHVPPDVQKQIDADRRGTAIGHVMMSEHGWKIGQPFTLRNPSDPKMSLTMIPIVELPTQYLSRVLFFQRKLFDDAVKNSYGMDIQDRASFIAVRVDRPENMGLVMNEIDEAFHNSDAETETVTESDSLANWVSSIGDVRAIIYSLCVVVLLTVLLIAANSMAMMVRDRIGEVAVMRALGFTRAHTATLLLIEAASIGLSGAVVGAGAALWYFRGGMTLGAITGTLGYMTVRPDVAIWAILVALGVSIASAVGPVINASRIPPAIAFRKLV
jgi:putative ABC transport system permease protein